MSIWAEIKYALNSTLGTEDFQPLDILLRSTSTLSATRATTNVIFSFDESYAYDPNAEKTIVVMKMLNPGNFRIKQEALTGSGYYESFFNIYKNNNVLYSKTADQYVYFQKGDVIKVTVTPNTTQKIFKVSARIYADINNTSSIEYLNWNEVIK